MLRLFHALVWKKLSSKQKKTVFKLIPKRFRKSIQNKVFTSLSDTLIISFPKCGRTWLRVMLSHYLVNHFELDQTEWIETQAIANNRRDIPRIYFTHDDNPHNKRADQLNADKKSYKKNKIIFLVRDPRDVLVSIFHHKKFRSKNFNGSLSDYLKQHVGSLDSILSFYNIWFSNRHIPQQFILIKYENFHSNPFLELKNVLEFCGIENLDDQKIHEAIHFAQFSNMRKMEKSDSQNKKLKPVDLENLSSFKTRKGKVGDYKNQFSDSEITFIDQKIQESLNPAFCY